jgi:hypothetical protein
MRRKSHVVSEQGEHRSSPTLHQYITKCRPHQSHPAQAVKHNPHHRLSQARALRTAPEPRPSEERTRCASNFNQHLPMRLFTSTSHLPPLSLAGGPAGHWPRATCPEEETLPRDTQEHARCRQRARPAPSTTPSFPFHPHSYRDSTPGPPPHARPTHPRIRTLPPAHPPSHSLRPSRPCTPCQPIQTPSVRR